MMAEGSDSSSLSKALGKMFLSESNKSNKYVLDLKNNNTRCFNCRFDIEFSKNALNCNCKTHWYCSPQCRDLSEQCKVDQQNPCNTLARFFACIRSSHGNAVTLKMIKNFLNARPNITRKELKNLAESGDWKAALVIGLTYEFRFICEWDKCAIALRPPFVKGNPFSNRKAIKYYNMALKHNSVEAMAGIGRIQAEHKDQTRASKDNLFAYYSLYKIPQVVYHSMFENDFISTELILIYKKQHQNGNPFVFRVPSVVGFIMFRLNLIDLNNQSSLVEECFSIHLFKEAYSFLKKKEVTLCCVANEHMFYRFCRSVENSIFIQKPDSIPDTLSKIDTERRMDVKAAALDQQYYHRLHQDQPWYVCKHYETIPPKKEKCIYCDPSASVRIMCVYKNLFQISRDETYTNAFYSVIYHPEDLKTQHDFFMNLCKQEVIIAIRVMALRPMDLHPMHVARDPNIYWPIIHYYGSVYAALKEILDEKTANEIYKKALPLDDDTSKEETAAEDKYVIKCGRLACLELDWKFNFRLCTRCRVRRYCSTACQKADWKQHKGECFLRPGLDSPGQDEVD